MRQSDFLAYSSLIGIYFVDIGFPKVVPYMSVKYQLICQPIPPIPAKLEFISEHSTNAQCTTVNHQYNVNSNILLGCNGGMQIFERHTGSIRHLENSHRPQVAEYRDELFMASRRRDEDTVHVYSFKTSDKSSNLLYSFPQESKKAAFLSISSLHIVVCENDGNKVKVYNRGSKLVCPKTLPGLSQVFNVLLLPNEVGLLATGGSIICKYWLVKEEPMVIWSTELKQTLCGVSVDERGLIYVNGMVNKHIYILSAEGKCMKEIVECYAV